MEGVLNEKEKEKESESGRERRIENGGGDRMGLG